MSNTKESVVLKYDDMGIPSIMLKVENTVPKSFLIWTKQTIIVTLAELLPLSI